MYIYEGDSVGMGIYHHQLQIPIYFEKDENIRINQDNPPTVIVEPTQPYIDDQPHLFLPISSVKW